MTDRSERIYVNSFVIVVWLAAVLGLLYGMDRFLKWML